MVLSVLLPVYLGTQSEELQACLNSLCDQTYNADEILLVKDGPLHPNTERIIEEYNSTLPLKLLAFQDNRGIGPALQDALPLCNYPLVARVDSDDRCLPRRFETQLDFLEENPTISVVGGQMRELYTFRGCVEEAIRLTPTDPSTLVQYAKFRNPMNHPTVMFRKSDVLRCGGYEECHLFEDYLLWAKMLVSGYTLANINDVLVETDINDDYFQRRGGIAYLKDEATLCSHLVQLGFFSLVDSILFLSTRAPIRLLPRYARQHIYRLSLRRKRTKRPETA